MIYRSLFFVSVLTLIGCSSKQIASTATVNPVENSQPTGHGLWYYLPKTVIRVEMVAEKRVEKAGPFFRFSQRFLNISDVITEDKEEWSIVGADVTTIGVPDKTRLFSVNTSGMPAMAALSLTDEGVICGVNLDTQTIYRKKRETHKKKDLFLTDVNFNDAPYTEEQLIKSSTTAMAEEVAREIYRLRALRTDILKGDVELLPPDKGAYEMVLAEIERKEKAYLELFIGKVEVVRVSKFYDFVPDDIKPRDMVLLRFSARNGFLDVMDVSGTPVYIEVELAEHKKIDLIAEENKKSLNTRGMVYCYPIVAQVRIVDRTLQLTSQQVLLAQFGQLVRMPADLLDNKDVGVEFDETTGAVKRIFYK